MLLFLSIGISLILTIILVSIWTLMLTFPLFWCWTFKRFMVTFFLFPRWEIYSESSETFQTSFANITGRNQSLYFMQTSQVESMSFHFMQISHVETMSVYLKSIDMIYKVFWCIDKVYRYSLNFFCWNFYETNFGICTLCWPTSSLTVELFLQHSKVIPYKIL